MVLRRRSKGRRIAAIVLSVLLAAAAPFAAAGQGEEEPKEERTQPPRLSEIRAIYIEEMPNDLHAYIAAEIVKRFKGAIRVVTEPEDADAILTGTGEYKSGVGAAVTGRYLGLHDTASAAVMLLDRTGETVLWADEAGDRSLLFGPFTRGGPRKVASRLVKKLKKAIEKDRKAKR